MNMYVGNQESYSFFSRHLKWDLYHIEYHYIYFSCTIFHFHSKWYDLLIPLDKWYNLCSYLIKIMVNVCACVYNTYAYALQNSLQIADCLQYEQSVAQSSMLISMSYPIEFKYPQTWPGEVSSKIMDGSNILLV